MGIDFRKHKHIFTRIFFVLGRLKQDDAKFKVSLDYITNKEKNSDFSDLKVSHIPFLKIEM